MIDITYLHVVHPVLVLRSLGGEYEEVDRWDMFVAMQAFDDVCFRRAKSIVNVVQVVN